MSPPSSPSKAPVFRRPSLSCKEHGHVVHPVEPDLEVIDLDAAPPGQCTPSASWLAPVRSAAGVPDHAPSRVKQVEEELATLVETGASLERRLRSEGDSGLAASRQALEQKRSHVEALQHAIDMASVGIGKAVAPEALSKAQISEVRQLARSPPENVRRALTAVWLVLHSDRFRGKQTVHLNDACNWLLCQRMLGDNSFVLGMQMFDPSVLEEVPNLLLEIARMYLGFQDSDVLLCGFHAPSLPASNLQRSHSDSSVCGSPARRSALLAFPSTKDLMQKLPGSRRATVGLGRDGSLGALRKMGAPAPTCEWKYRAQPKPLDVQEVEHASAPCGDLLRWLRCVVWDRARRACLLQELSTARAELCVAEKACTFAERLVADLQIEITANRSQQTHHEQAISNLRQAPVPISIRTHLGAFDAGVVKSPKARLKRRAMTPMSSDITFTKTNLAKGIWWRACERYKIPGSPSQIGAKDLFKRKTYPEVW